MSEIQPRMTLDDIVVVDDFRKEVEKFDISSITPYQVSGANYLHMRLSGGTSQYFAAIRKHFLISDEISQKIDWSIKTQTELEETKINIRHDGKIDFKELADFLNNRYDDKYELLRDKFVDLATNEYTIRVGVPYLEPEGEQELEELQTQQDIEQPEGGESGEGGTDIESSDDVESGEVIVTPPEPSVPGDGEYVPLYAINGPTDTSESQYAHMTPAEAKYERRRQFLLKQDIFIAKNTRARRLKAGTVTKLLYYNPKLPKPEVPIKVDSLFSMDTTYSITLSDVWIPEPILTEVAKLNNYPILRTDEFGVAYFPAMVIYINRDDDYFKQGQAQIWITANDVEIWTNHTAYKDKYYLIKGSIYIASKLGNVVVKEMYKQDELILRNQKHTITWCHRGLFKGL